MAISWTWILILCCLVVHPYHARASELAIRVVADVSQHGHAAELSDCDVSMAPSSCVISFDALIEVLKSQTWQRDLPASVKLVRVMLPAKTLRLREPLEIEWFGGSSGLTSLVVEGSPGGTILSGARVLNSNRDIIEATRLSNKLTTIARKNVVLFDMSGTLTNVGAISMRKGFGYLIAPDVMSVFSESQRLPMARWPNSGYAQIGNLGGLSKEDEQTFTIEGRDALDWLDEPNLQFMGFWRHDWASQLLPAYIDSKGRPRLEPPGSIYGIRPGQRVRVVNALRELDSPGEWYFDRHTQQLLVWPTSGSTTIEAGVASSIIRVKRSRRVSIKHLVIEKVLGDAVTIDDSEDVQIVSSIIRSANRGLVIRGGHECGIRNSTMHDFLEGGISMTGGNRIQLVPSGHFVESSTISDFATSDLTYRPAVDISGVGQRVSKNHIFNGPHSAIIFSGNNHVIDRNKLHDVVLATSDAGAIYTGRDFTAQGTKIYENFLHDIHSRQLGFEVKGIYLDDQASGTEIKDNTFARVSQPVFIGGGRSNRVIDNLFVESSPSIHLDARGLEWQRMVTLDPERDLQKRMRAVPYEGEIWRKSYPKLANIMNDDFGAPKYNTVCGNVFFRSTLLRISKSAISGVAVQKNREADINEFFDPNSVLKGSRLLDFKFRNDARQTTCPHNE